MNQIEIITRLSEEDRKLLEDLMGSVSLLASVMGSMQPPTIEPIPAMTHPVDLSTAPFEIPAPAPDPIAAAPAPAKISLGEFQKALSTRCAEGDATKQKVHDLIRQYAECVSAIPEEKRPEVLAALSKI